MFQMYLCNSCTFLQL